MPKAIDRAAAVPELRNAIWGIEVQDGSGRVLYERNAHSLLMPASNRKLFAASTVLDCFGLDHRFDTELWLDGSDRAGVGVSVGTSAEHAPSRPQAFGSLATAFPHFTGPGQRESIIVAIPDFPEFAQRVREIVWSGL